MRRATMCVLLAIAAGCVPPRATSSAPPSSSSAAVSSSSVSVAASSSASSAVGPLAPVAQYAEALKTALALAGKDWKVTTSSAISKKTCDAILGGLCSKTKKFEGARAWRTAHDRALTVAVSSFCAGDNCFADLWLVTDVRAPEKIEPFCAVAPDLSALFCHETRCPASEPMCTWNVDVRIERIDLVTHTGTPFADCVVPEISPGEQWVVCRTRNGDVYRVAIGGGKPQLFWSMPKDWQVPWAPGLSDYPPSVDFPAPTVMRVQDANGNVRDVPWVE